MHRVRNLVIALAAVGVTLACGFGSAPLAQGNGVATIVASTMRVLTPASPAATAVATTAAFQGIPVKYKNVSFTIPTGLASDAAPQTVPATAQESGGPWWEPAPEHIEFTLDGYSVLSNAFQEIRIDVFPADAYANVNTGANISLQRLKAALGNASAPLTNKTLPQVPDFNAASMIAAQIKRLSFQNGEGVRSVTQYGQAANPIANDGTFYHFQGLTSDGKFYIIAVLPVQAPVLQNGQKPGSTLPAGGVPYPANNQIPDTTVFEAYYNAVTDKLNALPNDRFTPSLANLDALVQSIRVEP
ncbi:MAG TPA: hypothetical protein VMJ64_08685 [Anaerolineales bacterium]|nr:hypothetical protein [Anaerolineales bacterium]